MADGLWLEFLSPERLCGLCGNHGFITTKLVSPAGLQTGITDKYCICPNGRILKKHGAVPQ